MKNHLHPILSGVLIVALMCISQLSIADTKLADKSLAQVTTTPAISYTTPQAELILPQAPSRLESIVNKAHHLSQGAGVLGKKVTTIIKKDVLGIQYSTQW